MEVALRARGNSDRNVAAPCQPLQLCRSLIPRIFWHFRRFARTLPHPFSTDNYFSEKMCLTPGGD